MMKRYVRSTVFAVILGSLLSGLTCFANGKKPTPQSIKEITQRVADWQIDNFDDHAKYRALPLKPHPVYHHRNKYHDLEWQMGALYAGIYQWSTVADKPEKCIDFLKMIGERNRWELHKLPYFADDHVVGQFYLSLYEKCGDAAMIAPTQKRFDWILENPRTGSLEWCRSEAEVQTDCRHRWGWCDALFMAPPVWARLAKITGDSRYLDFMDQEYHATYDFLWDKEEHLFWRDSDYFERREANGEKLFWSRGNGWVFGGLALMIPDLPKEWEGRSYYIELYKQMAAKLKTIQREDGSWSMGLLGGVEGYPIKEASGTAFYTFGMAWGINNGLLDRETYEPVVMKAWQALTACVTEEGLVGYVQPVGASPGDSFAGTTEVYGVGAFLAAGSEVYKLYGGLPLKK
jgi:rhamnogalacturonyl hydrolase YesR